MYKFINLYPTVDQDNVVLDEHSEQHPVNAYGASKRAVKISWLILVPPMD